MDKERIDAIIENEREWRAYLVENIETMKKEISGIKAWNLVFRVFGGAMWGAVLSILLIIIAKIIN